MFFLFLQVTTNEGQTMSQYFKIAYCPHSNVKCYKDSCPTNCPVLVAWKKAVGILE